MLTDHTDWLQYGQFISWETEGYWMTKWGDFSTFPGVMVVATLGTKKVSLCELPRNWVAI